MVWIGLATIASALLVCGYLWKRRIQTDFDFRMWVIARGAVMSEPEMSEALDFSPDSIGVVDALLGKIHERHTKKPLTEQELSTLCTRWGAYIGEALKKVQPGKWQRDCEMVGSGTTPLVFAAGHSAFPRSWVYKRIVDGEGDNVVSKFYVAAHYEELEKRPPESSPTTE
jgi:hypothetical protein